MRITEGDTDLGGRKTLASKLGNVLDDVLGRSLEPRGGSAAVREGRGRNALSGSVHATHCDSTKLVSDNKTVNTTDYTQVF